MQKTPPVTFYLDTRRGLTNGKFPLKLRVTFVKHKEQGKKWDQQYYPTGLSFTEAGYKKVLHNKTNASQPDYKKIRTIEQKAFDIVDRNPFITPDLFRSLFTGEYTLSADLSKLYDQRIKELNDNAQYSSRDVYASAIKSFELYQAGINLHAINVDWLKAYESWARRKGRGSKGLSTTSIGMYLITLRAMFKIGIKRRIIDIDAYPFGKGLYIIPKSSNPKKALNITDKNKVIGFKPFELRGKDLAGLEKMNRAMAIWKLSYSCFGMNIADIAYLTKDNIKGNVLTYIRKKTSTTERTESPQVIVLNTEALEVIATYGIHKHYLFGIISEADSKQSKFIKIKAFVKHVNKWVRKVTQSMGIEVDTRSYVARHTAANTLLEKGADIRDIKEALGHSSLTTTERYLASLDISGKRKLSEML